MQLAIDSYAVLGVLDSFEHDFSFATAEMSKCAESLTQSFVSRSIQELKTMTDFLAKNLEISENLPRRNAKISLARWISEALFTMVQINDELMAEDVEPTIAEVDAALENYVQIGAICEADLTNDCNKRWFEQRILQDCEAEFHGRCLSDYRDWFVKIVELEAFKDREGRLTFVKVCAVDSTNAFPIDYVLGKESTDLILLNEGYLNAKGFCGIDSHDTQKLNSLCDRILVNPVNLPSFHQVVYRVKVEGGGSQEIEAPTQVKIVEPVQVEIIEPVAFEIQLLGEYSFSERRTTQVPPYLIDENGNLFSKTSSVSTSVVT